ncbi:sigma-70 family RNA polymerase sigma factor [Acidovorax sp.]|uniref:sigma-70 family RNA polymerase sigma factor n=1 Tax=Acidovorax sp. TaxID=1872122 RepID=UPI002ACD9CED|nr:sigma-70 family RNA polymerase sigma factor [Acidovorax sp.]MDZ7865952.1 sigma-70 family RNA polymerase sigma factor [Acidovorax sp.]
MNCLSKAWVQNEAELRGWARQRMHNTADVDDLLQDLFLKALRQGERFCSVQNARAWLFEVARNTLADRLRVARSSVELPEDLPSPEIEQPQAVDILSACLPRVLSELSADDREAITLCDLQGVPQADYARAKGLTLSAAKSRVQRARVRMKQQMTTACRVQLDSAGHVQDFVARPPL